MICRQWHRMICGWNLRATPTRTTMLMRTRHALALFRMIRAVPRRLDIAPGKSTQSRSSGELHRTLNQPGQLSGGVFALRNGIQLACGYAERRPTGEIFATIYLVGRDSVEPPRQG